MVQRTILRLALPGGKPRPKPGPYQGPRPEPQPNNRGLTQVTCGSPRSRSRGPRRRLTELAGSESMGASHRGGAVIAHSIEIDRPPEDVFRYIDDLTRHAEWQDGIVSTTVQTQGPVGVGTQVREIRRVGGREQDASYEIYEHEPPRRTAFRGVAGPVRPVGKVNVEPLGNGTRSRASIEFDLIENGFGKLIAPIARWQARKEIAKSQEQLKARLEGGRVKGARCAARGSPRLLYGRRRENGDRRPAWVLAATAAFLADLASGTGHHWPGAGLWVRVAGLGGHAVRGPLAMLFWRKPKRNGPAQVDDAPPVLVRSTATL